MKSKKISKTWVYIVSIAAALAAGCFLLLTTLHAGLFVMLTLSCVSKDT